MNWLFHTGEPLSRNESKPRFLNECIPYGKLCQSTSQEELFRFSRNNPVPFEFSSSTYLSSKKHIWELKISASRSASALKMVLFLGDLTRCSELIRPAQRILPVAVPFCLTLYRVATRPAPSASSRATNTDPPGIPPFPEEIHDQAIVFICNRWRCRLARSSAPSRVTLCH